MKIVNQRAKFNLIPTEDVHPFPRGGTRNSGYENLSSENSITSESNGVLFFFTNNVDIPNNLSPMDANFWLLENCVSFMPVSILTNTDQKNKIVFSLTQVSSLPYANSFSVSPPVGFRYNNSVIVGQQQLPAFTGFPFEYIHNGDRTAIAGTGSNTTLTSNGNSHPTGGNNTAEPASMLLRSCEYCINALHGSKISNWIGSVTRWFSGTGSSSYNSYIVNSVFRLRKNELVNCLYLRKEKIGSLEWLGRMWYELSFWNGSGWQVIMNLDETVANAEQRYIMFTFTAVNARTFRLRSGHRALNTNSNLGTLDFVLGNTDVEYEAGSVEGTIQDCLLWFNSANNIQNSVPQDTFLSTVFQPVLKLSVGDSSDKQVQVQNLSFSETKSKVSPILIRSDFDITLGN